MSTAEHAPPARPSASVASGSVRVLACALRDHVADAPAAGVRFSLIVVALALQTAAFSDEGGFGPTSDAVLALVLVPTTLLGLLCAGLAVTRVDRWPLEIRRAVLIVGMIVGCILVGAGLPHAYLLGRASVVGTPYKIDAGVMDEYAASRVLLGQNPYLPVNFPYALEHGGLDLPSTVSTPLQQGQFSDARYSYPSDTAIAQALYNDQHYGPKRIPAEFESHYNYPALSFLFNVPFIAAGFHDLRPLYLLFFLGIIAYLGWHSPPSWRFAAPLLLLMDIPLLALTTGGQPDPMYAFFLVIAWGEWRSRRISGTSMGLALATKQLAWFTLPFYAVMILQEQGWKELIRRMLLAVAAFTLFNLPFIVLGPRDYVQSLAAPMTDPMFPLGSGLVALSVAGVLPLLPRAAYALIEVGVLAGAAAAWAASYARRFPGLGLVLAALPLVFAWRSLFSYFYLVPVLALAVHMADQRRQTDAV